MKAITLHAHEVRRLQHAGGVTLWRPVKPQPIDGGSIRWDQFVDVRDGGWEYLDSNGEVMGVGHCPHGAPGESRWVRETWAAIWPSDYPVPPQECNIEYRSDTSDPLPGQWPWDERDSDECPHWRSPVTMPKWASRYTVTVQAVTVKQVCDVTAEEIAATGYDDDIPAYNHTHFQNDWLRRYARLYPDDLWQLWCWVVTVTAQPAANGAAA